MARVHSFIAIMLFLFSVPAALPAWYDALPEDAYRVWVTNRKAAVMMLSSALSGEMQFLVSARENLYRLQAFDLWGGVLDSLSENQAVSEERLKHDLARGNLSKVPSGVRALFRYMPAEMIASEFGQTLSKEKVASAFLPLSDPDLFRVLKYACLLNGKYGVMDGLLLGNPLPLSNRLVLDWLCESIAMSPRDVRPILEKYANAKTPDYFRLKAISAFAQREFQEAGAAIRAGGLIPDDAGKRNRELGLDTDWVLANEAYRISLTNRQLSVRMIRDLILKDQRSVSTIREHLYRLQAFELWGEVLISLPENDVAAAEERLRHSFFAGETGRLPVVLAGLLRFRDPAAVASNYGSYLIEESASAVLRPFLTNALIFDTLRAAFTAAEKSAAFDDLLADPETRAEARRVLDWITGGIARNPRDVRPLLKRYAITNRPDEERLRAISAFAAGDYSAAGAAIRAGELRSTNAAARNRALGLDIDWILGNEAFRAGRFDEALRYSQTADRTLRPEMGRFRLLCMIGAGESGRAKLEAALMEVRPADAREFFTGFIPLLGPSNSGVAAIASYAVSESADTEAERMYLPESLLLTAAAMEGPDALKRAVALVRASLLGLQPEDGQAGFAAAYALSVGGSNSAAEGRTADFANYLRALQAMKDGKTASAREALTGLAASTNGSPLIRALSVFELRRKAPGKAE